MKLINSVQNEIVRQFGAIHVKCHLNVITCVTMSEEQPYQMEIECRTMNKKRSALAGKISVPGGQSLSKSVFLNSELLNSNSALTDDHLYSCSYLQCSIISLKL